MLALNNRGARYNSDRPCYPCRRPIILQRARVTQREIEANNPFPRSIKYFHFERVWFAYEREARTRQLRDATRLESIHLNSVDGIIIGGNKGGTFHLPPGASAYVP